MFWDSCWINGLGRVLVNCQLRLKVYQCQWRDSDDDDWWCTDETSKHQVCSTMDGFQDSRAWPEIISAQVVNEISVGRFAYLRLDFFWTGLLVTLLLQKSSAQLVKLLCWAFSLMTCCVIWQSWRDWNCNSQTLNSGWMCFHTLVWARAPSVGTLQRERERCWYLTNRVRQNVPMPRSPESNHQICEVLQCLECLLTKHVWHVAQAITL